MIKEEIVLIIAWASFYFLHSLFAATAVRERTRMSRQKYRLLYNTIAGITLTAVVILSLYTPSRLVIVPRGWMQPVGLLLAVWGVWIVNLSFRYYNFREFAGLSKPAEGGTLQKKGLLSLVRHPIYLGTLMILSGYFLYSPTSTALIIFLVSLVYVFVGIQLEERKLLEEFGEEYREYCKEVPMILPLLKF